MSRFATEREALSRKESYLPPWEREKWLLGKGSHMPNVTINIIPLQRTLDAIPKMAIKSIYKKEHFFKI